jgi:hypothetical protein
MEYIYNINKILKKNIDTEGIEPNTQIHICLYQVLFKNNSTFENPYLQYLMYKYQKSDNVNEVFTFPFINYKGGNIRSIIKKVIKGISGIENPIYKGFKMYEGNIFVFFEHINTNYVFKQLQSTNKYWFVLMDEICNKRKVLNYNIHSSVTQLFLENPDLIYLYDNKNNTFEIPTVAYRGDHIDILAYLAAFGQRRSTRSRFGPFYTLGTINWALRYAGWSKNYQKHVFQGKSISDNNGKYNKCGLIRYAIFLGDLEKYYVLLNNKKNYFNYLLEHQDTNKDLSKSELEVFERRKMKETGKWSSHYKSLVIPKIKYTKNTGYFNINTEYIISDSNNKISLSIHEIDSKSLGPIWVPLHNNYKIL